MSTAPSPIAPKPVVISVAPNGARKTPKDHPNIPITPEELAKEARNCVDNGATMLHLHVRNKDYTHSIKAEYYQEAIATIRKEVSSDELVLQVTSEACGIFTPEEQMQMVRTVKPEAVSLGLRELVPSAEYEAIFAHFLKEILKENTQPQYILYSEEDLQYFNELATRGIIPGERYCLLFVLGRYSKGQRSTPIDLLPYLNTLETLPTKTRITWFVCAFGPQEHDCMLSSALLGGNARIGFENNLYLTDGSVANSNAALVQQFAQTLGACQRPIASVDQAKEAFFCA